MVLQRHRSSQTAAQDPSKTPEADSDEHPHNAMKLESVVSRTTIRLFKETVTLPVNRHSTPPLYAKTGGN